MWDWILNIFSHFFPLISLFYYGTRAYMRSLFLTYLGFFLASMLTEPSRRSRKRDAVVSDHKDPGHKPPWGNILSVWVQSCLISYGFCHFSHICGLWVKSAGWPGVGVVLSLETLIFIQDLWLYLYFFTVIAACAWHLPWLCQEPGVCSGFSHTPEVCALP